MAKRNKHYKKFKSKKKSNNILSGAIVAALVVAVVGSYDFFTENISTVNDQVSTNQSSSVKKTSSTKQAPLVVRGDQANNSANPRNPTSTNKGLTTKKAICKIASVHDGDSMRVRCPNNKNTIAVRLAEIDAPETDQEYGLKARNYLRNLCVKGKKAEIHTTELDMYGRTLARVYCNGVDVNAEMIKTGNAWVYEYYAKDKSLFELQNQAKKQKLGLWNTNKKVEAPWDFRYKNKKANQE